MLFENSQDDFELNLPSNITKVGIKISGGADSAIVAYMLAKYVAEERPDITIIPISLNSIGKHYQQMFASKVLNKITEITGVRFGQHFFKTISAKTSEIYVNNQNEFVWQLYKHNIMQTHFVGITANPDPKDAPELYIDLKRLPSDDRSKTKEKRPHLLEGSFRPLINIDKRGVAEHYTRLGVMDKIFPLTRSCEAYTEDFSKHCEQCWFCQERKWGFGRFV